jgi:Big-like domain-containing protein
MRTHFCAVVVLACGLAATAAPENATARPYTVVACDSAPAYGYTTAAWAPFGVPGHAYAICPSYGGFTAGLSNRLTGVTYSGFTVSGHAFIAPPGATITHLRWSGRIARDSCDWGAFMRAVPSGNSIVGLPAAQFCSSMNFDTRSSPLTFAVPPGTTEIQQVVVCAAHQCAPGATIHSGVLEVTVDDPVLPSIALDGPLASGQWVSGPAGGSRVDVHALDNSGVRTIEAVVGARSETQEHGCAWARTQPCPGDVRTWLAPAIGDLRDGRHTLTVSATDAAGNSSAVAREVRVDNTPPDPVTPEIANGDAWRRRNEFLVSWVNPTDDLAPVVRAHWKLCAKDGGCPEGGHHDGQNVQSLPPLDVPEPGDYRLHVWLEDAAGNAREESAAITATLRFDPEPPQLTFEPTDPADPLRVVVNAVDRHSGVARGEIEMRASGTTTWHGLATDREGSLLIAHVDDERFRNGAYEFRAHAVDQAGNEASSGRRADGSAATLRLPARIDTRLAVGVPRLILRRRVEHRHGHRRLVRRRIRRLDSNVVAGHGRVIRLSGFLANTDGQPIDGATIEALEKRPVGGVAPIGLATTGTDGKFHYVVKATRNREILFRYGGSRRIRSATTDFTLLVPARTTIRPNRERLLNGQQVLFSGGVFTRPLPADGKLVEMQAYFRGRWRTFSTVRAGPNGRWNFPYRFGGTIGRVTYRFRARLPAEGGYPFITGNSRVVKVVVIGP